MSNKMMSNAPQARSFSGVSLFLPSAVFGLNAGDPAPGAASTLRSTRCSLSSTCLVECLEGSMCAGKDRVMLVHPVAMPVAKVLALATCQ